MSADVLREAMNAIVGDLSSITGRPRPETLVAMGGAVTNLAAVSCDGNVHGPKGSKALCSRAPRSTGKSSCTAQPRWTRRRAIPGLQPKRADVILAGACIVRTVMEKLGKDELTVSDRGLRHGLLVERFG